MGESDLFTNISENYSAWSGWVLVGGESDLFTNVNGIYSAGSG